MKRAYSDGGVVGSAGDESASEASKKRRVEVRTELKPLQDLDVLDVNELKCICSDAEVMRYVRDSKPWTPAYVEKLCEWARKDAMEAADPKKKKAEDSRVEYWHWAIVEHHVSEEKESPAVAKSETRESKEDKLAEEGTQQEKDGAKKEEREKQSGVKEQERESAVVRDVVVGYVGLRPVPHSNPPVLQVRIFISREHQHRGHAKRALQLVKTFANDNLSWCPEIQSFVRQDNKASSELFTRAGYQRRGVKRFGRECEDVFFTPLHVPSSSDPEPSS